MIYWAFEFGLLTCEARGINKGATAVLTETDMVALVTVASQRTCATGQSGSSIYTSCGSDGCVVGRGGILLHRHGGGDISQSGQPRRLFLVLVFPPSCKPQTAFFQDCFHGSQQASAIGFPQGTRVKARPGDAAVTPVHSPRPARYVAGTLALA